VGQCRSIGLMRLEGGLSNNTFFLIASLPARITGICASELASIAVVQPEQPYASSSLMTHASIVCRPRPPYASGMWQFARPISQALSKTSCGNCVFKCVHFNLRVSDSSSVWASTWSVQSNTQGTERERARKRETERALEPPSWSGPIPLLVG
jgi:Pyruvate/2-oxoacid:ferredoxin oxidoreductase delta subunit